MSAISSRRPRLRGLAVKLALVSTVVMLAFGWLRDELTMWAFDTFAIESPDSDQEQRARDLLLASMEEAATAESDNVDLEACLQRLRRRQKLVYAVTVQGKVVAWPLELEGVPAGSLASAPFFRLAIDGQQIGVALSRPRPLFSKSKLQGIMYVLSYFLDPEAAGHPHWKKAPVLELPPGTTLTANDRLRAEVEGSRSRDTLIITGVSAVISILTALILAILVAILVTRRLRRLAAEVEASEWQEAPSPFREEGNDEIASLASALNSMRTRISGLVGSLREKDTQRRDWIAQVSHDLRTPLTSLSICLNRAQAELGQNQAIEAQGTLDLACHDLVRVRSLVNDLFELARLELADKLDLEPIPLHELIVDAARSLRPQAELRGVALEVDMAGDGEEIRGDGHRLLRACENLLSNAVRHAQSAVRIGVEDDGGYVCIYVTDDGSGFKGQSRIESGSVRSAGNGKAGSGGIGLFVASRVAEAHGGALRVRERSGALTRVEIRLPRLSVEQGAHWGSLAP